MKNHHLFALSTLGLLGAVTSSQAQSIIYFDSFTHEDGTILLGLSPETNNGVEGATYHESNNFWTTNSDVGVFNNRAQLGADNQLNLPFTSDDFVLPEVIGVSVLLNLGDTDGPDTAITTGEQRGVGLGVFADTNNLATPVGFRGLEITTDGRLILAEHGFGGSLRAGFIEEIANGIDTALDHTLSYEIDTTTGDISNILLDGEEQPDVETTIFDSDINHVGVMVSSAAGGTTASYDDFTVTDGPLGGSAADPAITSITPVDATTYELTIVASPETDYALAASASLDFENSTLVTGLTQGSPEDPGVVNPEGDLITTDAEGNATLRISSAVPKNFVRVETPPAVAP